MGHPVFRVRYVVINYILWMPYVEVHRWTIVGLTSFGTESRCTTAKESLNAFTRVDVYLDWIMDTIKRH